MNSGTARSPLVRFGWRERRDAGVCENISSLRNTAEEVEAPRSKRVKQARDHAKDEEPHQAPTQIGSTSLIRKSQSRYRDSK